MRNVEKSREQLISEKLELSGRLEELEARYEETKEQLLSERGRLEELKARYKETNAALQDSEEQYRAVINKIEDGYFEVDITGALTYFNNSLCNILGYPAEELHNLDYRHYTSRDFFDRVFRVFNKVYKSEVPEKYFDWVIVRKDGSRRTIEVSISLIKGRGGRKIGFRGIVRDITERKIVERKLRESINFNHVVVNSIPANIAVLDRDGKVVTVNDGWESYTNKDKEVIPAAGKDYREVCRRVFGEDYEDVWFGIKKVLEGQASGFLREHACCTGGERRWFLMRVAPLAGKRGGAVISHVDITERKLMEEKLQESEEKYRQLVKNARAGIYELDCRNLRFTSVNDVMCEYTGYTRAEFMQLNPEDLLSKDSKEHFRERIRALSRGESVAGNTEFKVFDRWGREFWVLVNSRFVCRDGKPEKVTVVAHDITERKQAEEALQESEELYRSLVELSPDLILVHQDNKIVFTNARHFRVNSPREAIGKSILDYVDPNSWDKVQDRIRPMLEEGKTVPFAEEKFIRQDGSVFEAEVAANCLLYRGKPAIQVVARDITERKEMEREMVRLEKLNLVGEIAKGLGHEIKNPMTPLRGLLQIMRGKEKFSGYWERIDLMIRELDRANSIIDQFLSLSKNRPVHRQEQNLNTILSNLQPLLQADAFKAGKYIQLDLNGIPDLLLDENDIRALVFNLARNGLEAIDPGKKVTIKTYTVNEKVILSVQDEGEGIPPHIMEQLGTPFVTTKDHGTGLGLPICYKIAEIHNAVIDVRTSSSGTTVRVLFRPE